jgi:HAD superfamily hydrolase (TIGR01490 family)
MKQPAAIFDLDRTLVPLNTASLFVKHQYARGEARRRDVLRSIVWLGQYTLGVIDAMEIASRATRRLAGRNEEQFAAMMQLWVDAHVLPRVSQLARMEVERRKQEGYLCAILTGSTPYSALPVGRALGIDHVIATELEVKEGCFTGNLVAPICFGRGKLDRAEIWAKEHGIDLSASLFYSDSASDLPMLERVREPFAVNPDPRLRVIAKLRGWPRLYWT